MNQLRSVLSSSMGALVVLALAAYLEVQGDACFQLGIYHSSGLRRAGWFLLGTLVLSGNGNVLLIEGTSMAGTEAAWDFVSDDSELLPFLKRIQHPDGKIPHFELLLGTQNMSSSAVHSNLLAWRTAD
jgi:hypothetical protein